MIVKEQASDTNIITKKTYKTQPTENISKQSCKYVCDIKALFQETDQNTNECDFNNTINPHDVKAYSESTRTSQFETLETARNVVVSRKFKGTSVKRSQYIANSEVQRGFEFSKATIRFYFKSWIWEQIYIY